MRTIVLKDGRVHRGSRKTSSTRASIMAEDIQTAHALSLKSVLTPAPTHFSPLRLLRWHNVSRILQTLWQNCDRSAMAEWLMEMFEWLLNQVFGWFMMPLSCRSQVKRYWGDITWGSSKALPSAGSGRRRRVGKF